MFSKILFLKSWNEVIVYNKLRYIYQPVTVLLLHKRRESTNISESASEFIPVSVAQSFLESIHSFSHLPWWCTITLTCVGLRAVITLPLAVYQNKLITKIELLQPTLKELTVALKHRVTIEGRRKGWSSQAANSDYKKKLRKFTYNLYSSNGCNPIKLYTLPWAQIPLWVVISLALRNLSGALRWNNKDSPLTPHPEMSSEGTFWFSDLTVPDPTGILPVSLGVLNLANIELHALKRKTPSRKQRVITMIFRSFSLCMIVIAYKVPAAMSLYWSVSAGFGLIQNILLKFPHVRRFLGIAKTPSENAKPFTEMVSIISSRTEKFLKLQREELRKK